MAKNGQALGFTSHPSERIVVALSYSHAEPLKKVSSYIIGILKEFMLCLWSNHY